MTQSVAQILGGRHLTARKRSLNPSVIVACSPRWSALRRKVAWFSRWNLSETEREHAPFCKQAWPLG